MSALQSRPIDTKKRVLVVEDDPDAQTVYHAILTHAGFEVSIAGNGRDAVERARSEHPDVILMDIDLPVLEGWGARVLLTRDARTRQIPVVGICASASAEHFRRASLLGFEAYHAKPFRPMRVLAEVRRLVEPTPP